MYKKCDARAKLLFCLLKLVFSFDVVVAVASLDLKVPIDKPPLLIGASIYPLLESVTWIPLKNYSVIITAILRILK